jgi:hypothetical protein
MPRTHAWFVQARLSSLIEYDGEVAYAVAVDTADVGEILIRVKLSEAEAEAFRSAHRGFSWNGVIAIVNRKIGKSKILSCVIEDLDSVRMRRLMPKRP